MKNTVVTQPSTKVSKLLEKDGATESQNKEEYRSESLDCANVFVTVLLFILTFQGTIFVSLATWKICVRDWVTTVFFIMLMHFWFFKN